MQLKNQLRRNVVADFFTIQLVCFRTSASSSGWSLPQLADRNSIVLGPVQA
ncbi:hypothetical protein DY78_GL000771 [Lactiplantibacillus fabifermentans DSM 21115]|uniref:Uncharacterized protein n=1 Tax=Lactiplantibacillus fabifermentans DSM 21115 TaxID=1413187 RepID=A0A0R2NRV2_9LACO|nr:hypothetical protein DY78_GL000771 [Lactiplantibacillus fabifermentans DSM 21115]